jgi:hypothetical protein
VGGEGKPEGREGGQPWRDCEGGGGGGRWGVGGKTERRRKKEPAEQQREIKLVQLDVTGDLRKLYDFAHGWVEKFGWGDDSLGKRILSLDGAVEDAKTMIEKLSRDIGRLKEIREKSKMVESVKKQEKTESDISLD